MKDIFKKSPGIEKVFENYSTKPVPNAKRFGWVTQSIVWSGIAFSMAMFSLGGILASAMNFTTFLTVVLFGSTIITVIACLNGLIGAKTHLASAVNSRFALGVEGGRIFGLVLAVSLFGWFGYQCYYFASSTVSALQMFGFSGAHPIFWAVAVGLLMIATAVAGFNGITLLSKLGVPLLFILALIAAVLTSRQVDSYLLKSASEIAAGGMHPSSGFVIVVGSFISGACIVPDISRFSRRPKDAVWGCILGYMIFFPVLLLLGGFFYYAYGTSDLCDIFVHHCGLGMFVPFLLVVSTWTTNDYNLYSSVLGISNALEGRVKLPRWLLTLIVGLISTMLGALGVMAQFTAFLNLLGVLIPPIVAVIIADYYLYNRNSGLYAYENMDKLARFRVNTCLSAVVGIVVGLLCSYTKIGLYSVLPASIVAMLASVIALVLYNAVSHIKVK